MFIKPGSKSRSAFTLPEMMVGLGVFAISGLALAGFMMLGLRSFTSMANYALLDQKNRQAMDQLTYEIRQAQLVVDYVTNATSSSLSIINGSGTPVTYTFNASKLEVQRTDPTGTSVLLTNCNLLNFGLYMRPPTNGSFDVYQVPMTTNWQASVKVIQLTWKTAMALSPTLQINSEDVQTARIIIRKQQGS